MNVKFFYVTAISVYKINDHLKMHCLEKTNNYNRRNQAEKVRSSELGKNQN